MASAQKALAALDSATAVADTRQQQRQARDLQKQQHKLQEGKQGCAAAEGSSRGPLDTDGAPSETVDAAEGGSRQREMDDFGNFDDGSDTSSRSGPAASDIDSSSDSEPSY